MHLRFCCISCALKKQESWWFHCVKERQKETAAKWMWHLLECSLPTLTWWQLTMLTVTLSICTHQTVLIFLYILSHLWCWTGTKSKSVFAKCGVVYRIYRTETNSCSTCSWRKRKKKSFIYNNNPSNTEKTHTFVLQKSKSMCTCKYSERGVKLRHINKTSAVEKLHVLAETEQAYAVILCTKVSYFRKMLQQVHLKSPRLALVTVTVSTRD